MKQLLVLMVFILLVIRAKATTFYVDAANSAPATPFTNWLAAATNIQDAIDVATNGDLIWSQMEFINMADAPFANGPIHT